MRGKIGNTIFILGLTILLTGGTAGCKKDEVDPVTNVTYVYNYGTGKDSTTRVSTSGSTSGTTSNIGGNKAGNNSGSGNTSGNTGGTVGQPTGGTTGNTNKTCDDPGHHHYGKHHHHKDKHHYH